MKKISIIKNGVITNQAEFNTDELLNEWLDNGVKNCYFGNPERNLIDYPSSPVSEELKAIAISTEIVTDLDGNEFTSYKIPAEYTVEIEDITQEIEEKKSKEEKRKKDRRDRFDQLKKLDWSKIDTIAELKAVVKALTKEALKDENEIL